MKDDNEEAPVLCIVKLISPRLWKWRSPGSLLSNGIFLPKTIIEEDDCTVSYRKLGHPSSFLPKTANNGRHNNFTASLRGYDHLGSINFEDVLFLNRQRFPAHLGLFTRLNWGFFSHQRSIKMLIKMLITSDNNSMLFFEPGGMKRQIQKSTREAFWFLLL